MKVLNAPLPFLTAAFAPVYGPSQDIIAGRVALLRPILESFLHQFGDRPVRIFRSPGRINMRGMHVDTHGGYLNLMTHQREIMLVTAQTDDDAFVFANTDRNFGNTEFGLTNLDFARSWMEFIALDAAVQTAIKGEWANYVRGAITRACRAAGRQLPGMVGVIGSDLPQGAALSSSHALCVATLHAALSWNGIMLTPEERILAIRDAEWYTGARTGTSDQAAMVLGRQNTLVNVALLAEDLDCSGARYLPFPGELAILVINSFTTRSLSGAQRIAYTRNRFAYSMALEILRQEMTAMECPPKQIAAMDRLSRISPEALGGLKPFYRIMLRIPEELSIAQMRQRYALPNFEEAYDRYFGGVPVEQRPDTIAIRGPLLYGIAESERARAFLPALESGQFALAGKLMTAGHDGDRLKTNTNEPYHRSVTDQVLRHWESSETPVMLCPGDYGASSPVLDLLVDTALRAGALGACLTGAGIAGTVLALCQREKTTAIMEALCNKMASEEYARLASLPSPLTTDQLHQAVLINQAPAGAGELCFPSCPPS